ncbi:hypothetical protein SapgrDRAFT_2032 [Saprospira grandis DSM 2844]|uniref:Uncharacterized protein n=1 Tax=Saprospira grandis DSM 2844 TaxID=694433 RepID=J1I4R7_9BACT|nr:DUF6428 family protein [Saprospira grandis]EJF53720.1 hypothetical protein SapgrDRAFT_2032 [Saprospira grandis DSM 2844]
MKLSALKTYLGQVERLTVFQQDGQSIPAHFHLTELGEVRKKFMDCGGQLREQKELVLQFWVADDLDHRLAPSKMLKIIELAEQKLQLSDLELAVEYQGTNSLEYYWLDINASGQLILNAKQTDCLAKEACGITFEGEEKEEKSSCCGPNSGCC